MERNTKQKQIASAVILNGSVNLDISTPKHPKKQMLCDYKNFALWRDTPEFGRISFLNITGHGYAAFNVKTQEGQRCCFYFEAFATGFKWERVCHINQNTLDNRVSNLQEFMGQVCYDLMPKKDKLSGIGWVKKQQKWRVRIKVNGVNKSLGCFYNLEDAIEARHQGEVKYWG